MNTARLVCTGHWTLFLFAFVFSVEIATSSDTLGLPRAILSDAISKRINDLNNSVSAYAHLIGLSE
jgi:hypothetical protein